MLSVGGEGPESVRVCHLISVTSGGRADLIQQTSQSSPRAWYRNSGPLIVRDCVGAGLSAVPFGRELWAARFLRCRAAFGY